MQCAQNLSFGEVQCLRCLAPAQALAVHEPVDRALGRIQLTETVLHVAAVRSGRGCVFDIHRTLIRATLFEQVRHKQVALPARFPEVPCPEAEAGPQRAAEVVL